MDHRSEYSHYSLHFPTIIRRLDDRAGEWESNGFVGFWSVCTWETLMHIVVSFSLSVLSCWDFYPILAGLLCITMLFSILEYGPNLCVSKMQRVQCVCAHYKNLLGFGNLVSSGWLSSISLTCAEQTGAGGRYSSLLECEFSRTWGILPGRKEEFWFTFWPTEHRQVSFIYFGSTLLLNKYSPTVFGLHLTCHQLLTSCGTLCGFTQLTGNRWCERHVSQFCLGKKF